MATAATSPATSVDGTAKSKSGFAINRVTLPYIIAIAAQLPLLLYYFSQLWARPHYQFFPFALIMVVAFAVIRWPRNLDEPFFARKLSFFLFWTGILFGVTGALFATSWYSAASMVMLFTSLFAMTKDGEVSGKTLLPLSLPLLIILMLPFNLDFTLITSLQRVSAQISSWFLDILNFKHYSPGTTLNFPNQNYEVERACSGVQSFFTLMFCTSFLIVSLRRPWWRGILLLLSAGFWAVFMNSIRILIIPIADQMFGIDLKEGLRHELLGYTVMLVAIALILSTDQLLEFLFGRSGHEVDDEGKPGWMRRVFGKKDRSTREKDDTPRYRPVPGWFKTSALVGAIIMLFFGIVQFVDFLRAANLPRKHMRLFSTWVIIDLDRKAMPELLESTDPDGKTFRWQLINYSRQDRPHGSDFGERSDQWTYRSLNSRVRVHSSIDQTFPGWHELTTCYKNQGWRLSSLRQKRSQKIVNEEGEEIDWTYVEVELIHPALSKRGFLLFSFTDAGGVPFEAPIEWGNIRAFVERLKNRLNYNVRSTLFRGEAYQMQAFVESPYDFKPDLKEEIRSQYFEARKAMRKALLKYGDNGDEEDLGAPENGAPPGDSRSPPDEGV